VSDHFLFRISPSMTIRFVSSILICLAAITFAFAVTEPNTLSDAYCGAPPPGIRSEPVVLPPHENAVTVPVAIAGFAFDPSSLTINVGDTVMWTNNDGASHTSSSDTGIWNSGTLMLGQTFSFTFNTAGTFPYHCGFHGFMTASITVKAAASPTPSPAISGTIIYGNAVGAPTPRSVPNVLLSGAGSPNVSATTNSAGAYTLTGFGTGSYTVTASKTDGVNGISSFDAAKVAQHASGTVVLIGNALTVADVSGNGTVSSFDAGLIAKYAAGISPAGQTGTWKFIPPSRNYASVNANVTGEDFVALLMGEVSGNWINNTPAPAK
jgi:plastocyanin